MYLSSGEKFDSLKMWRSLSSWKVLRWDMLEAYVAAFSFALWISLYRILDQFPILQQYKMGPPETAVPLQLSYLSSWLPLIVYLGAIHLFHTIKRKAPITVEAPSWHRVLVELVTGIVLYDFIFFWIHLAMHRTPHWSWVHKHYIHHDQETLTASEVQHHSFIDSALQVSVNILVQNVRTLYGSKHTLSRLLHNVLITYVLTEIHAGYNGFWSMHNLLPSFVGGAQAHELHHRLGRQNYQQFFSYLDRLLGTYRKN